MFFSPCFLSLRSCLLNYDMADMAESGAGSAEVASDRDTVTLADAAAASDDFGKSSSATMQEQMRAEEAEYMTRYSLEWNSGVACWSQERRSEDPISDYDSPMPAPKRAPRAWKYGRCSVHGCPFKVHLVKTGPNSNQIWIRCAKFWERLPNGKPGCWKGGPYRGDKSSLPKSILHQQAHQRKHTGWLVKHGPQTKR